MGRRRLPDVNGAGQQGLTRFTNATPASPPPRPSCSRTASSQASWISTSRPSRLDDSTLTYRLLKRFQQHHNRDLDRQSPRRGTGRGSSHTDTSSAPGEVTNYRVEVTDGSTTIRGNYSNAITVASAASTAYDQIVNADGPQAYWRLGEPAGTTTSADASGQSNNGTFTGVTLGGAGAIAGNTAMTTSSSSGRMVGEKAYSFPQQFTVEAWVKQSGLHPRRPDHRLRQLEDRQQRRWRRPDAYMRTNGSVVFGANDGSQRTLTSPVRQERRVVAPRGRQLRPRDDEAVRRRRTQRQRTRRLGVGVLRLVAGWLRPDQLVARRRRDPDRNGHRRGSRLPVRTHPVTGPIPLCSKV